LASTLYVPPEGMSALAILAHEGPKAFLAEIERLARSGAPWAAAISGYVYCMPNDSGKRDPAKAIEMCAEPAAAGDPYASYVLGWALGISGRHAEALEMLQQAAAKGFGPAAMDLASFFMMGWGTSGKNIHAAFRALHLARKLGHRGAVLRYCGICRLEKCGTIRKICAAIVRPFAFWLYSIVAYWNPVSIRVFNFGLKRDARMFKPSVQESDQFGQLQ
jgi:TPR repeat protein